MAREEDMLLFRIEDGVGIITLNRPHKLNAISWDLAEELSRLLYRLRDDDAVRVVLLHGAGRAFCAGGDLEFISGDSERPMPGTSDPSRPMARSQRKTPGGPFVDVVRQMVALDKPVIAAIHGAAVGAGLGYAMACDRRFGDTTTRMSAIFTNVGVSPDCGVSWFLPRLVGLSNALMLVETAKILNAEESRAIGLLDELVPEGKAFEAALDYARTIASRASVAVDMARRLIYRAQTTTLEDILDYEAAVGTMVASAFDAKEGATAFLEKRKPVFRGN
ncbi:MAG: enoyl-CoA hydratase/isomerase family protein [Pseudomonadales bacterium]|jgi:2-(1,2-epoxy-1,2-dihydrophenyl)acetyl-CoA isomerase|nr:enoyl-CoA hydratase/isomerase family protein [Pseudomonadales bacterium]MBP9032682.1 enoyl-CoA hydratase/isomerase family protein [Pseudomonadales bacterium]